MLIAAILFSMPDKPTESLLSEVVDEFLNQVGGVRAIGKLKAKEMMIAINGYEPSEEEAKNGKKSIPRASAGIIERHLHGTINLLTARDLQTSGNGNVPLDEQRKLLWHEAIQQLSSEPDVREKFMTAIARISPDAIAHIAELAQTLRITQQHAAIDSDN